MTSFSDFVSGVKKHIFVDEALTSKRAVKWQTRADLIIDLITLGRYASGGFEHEAPRHGEEALERDIGVLRRSQQTAKQWVCRKHRKVKQTEQDPRGQILWPRLGCPRHAGSDCRVELDKVGAYLRKLAWPGPRLGQSAAHGNSNFVIV